MEFCWNLHLTKSKTLVSNLLKYWEHYDGNLPSSLSLPVDSAEILFTKRRGDEPCLQLRKIDNAFRLKLSYYVGVDRIPNTNQPIYVEPKLNETDSQTDYLKMLFSALKHPEVSKYTDELFEIKSKEEPIRITQQQDLLTPLLVVQFLRVVKDIVRKGLKKSYYKVENNLYAKVKGKVLVSQTIKKNLLKNKPLNTYCSYDEFGLNGLENRLLKKTLVFVQRYLPTLKIPNSKEYTTDIFNYVNPAFEFVSEDVDMNDVKHTKTNAFYKEYEEGLRLAKLILKRFGYNITNTQQQTIKTPPFWIDMSKLFELYVLGLLKDVYGGEVVFQHSGFYGNPDFLTLNKKQILDAKYKTYYNFEKLSGLEQWKRDRIVTDIRQLSGYARDVRIFEKLELAEDVIVECIIIYPVQNSQTKTDESFTIDLSKANEIGEFIKFKTLGVLLPVLSK